MKWLYRREVDNPSHWTRLDYEEIAQMIEAEGRLIVGKLIHHDVKTNAVFRCAVGVINEYEHTSNQSRLHYKYFLFVKPHKKITSTNDSFRGTPEERATFMAAKFREWDNE